jgi:hypothetical protein
LFVRKQRKLPVLELDDFTNERLCLLLLVLHTDMRSDLSPGE